MYTRPSIRNLLNSHHEKLSKYSITQHSAQVITFRDSFYTYNELGIHNLKKQLLSLLSSIGLVAIVLDSGEFYKKGQVSFYWIRLQLSRG